MQLGIRDLTKLLQATEAQVLRWIKHCGLPAQQLGGQFRVNRAELLEWATANDIKVSLELFDHLKEAVEPVPSLSDALEAGGIHYGLPGTNKAEVLRSLVQVLPVPESVDREHLLRLFLAREASASTALGDGIAIPHVRNPTVLHVNQPSITLTFLERPVDFEALDRKPVQILFSAITPTNRCHLQLLARLAHALHDAKFRETLIRRAPQDEILKEARRLEANMDAPNNPTRKVAQ